MTVRPILFSGPMVRALLEGRKTQTRRVLNKLRGFGKLTEFGLSDTSGYEWHFRDKHMRWHDLTTEELMKAVPYHVGDLLYVREAHYLTDDGHEEFSIPAIDEAAVKEHLERVDNLPAYFAPDLRAKHRRLRPPMHMPRWASRLTLKVTDVRVQRLQGISNEDAKAEGCPGWYAPSHPDSGSTDGRQPWEEFRELWDSLNDERGFGWQVDPWVVAVTFDVHQVNVDRIEQEAAA